MFLEYGTVSEFYIGFFKGSSFDPCLVLIAAEASVNYLVEVLEVGYHEYGTILANSRVIVNLPRHVIVSSYNDQSKGIYLKTSSNKVIVIGQTTKGRLNSRFTAWDLETFIVNEITDLSISEYEYFAISMNSSHDSYFIFNSSVLIVGTRNDTSLRLMVTQPVTTRIGNANVTTLIPGREYSFVINRLQTVYLSSANDLTGTKIVTSKPVSVFSGHGYTGIPMDTYPLSYLIEQMPPTALWGSVYYVIPLNNRHTGYAVKVLAASECVINIHFSNFTSIKISLRTGNSFYKVFMNKETFTIHSASKILVVQFSLGLYRYVGPMMTLLPSPVHYLSKIRFSTVFSEYNYSYYDTYNWPGIHYINIIVVAQYYQPGMIYLVTNGINKSLDTQEWLPIEVNNVIVAYGTTVDNISLGMFEIIHVNKEALMSAIVYGFPRYGGYGTTTNAFSSEMRKYFIIVTIKDSMYIRMYIHT